MSFVPKSSPAFAAMLCLALGPALGQAESQPAASRPGPESRPEPAELALRKMDEGLNDPVAAGLRRLRFSYRPTATGMPDPDFRVQVTWRHGGATEVDFLTLEKKPLDRSQPHPWLDAADPDRGDKRMADRYVEGGKALLGLFLRPGYSRQFATWRKRLETRVVNQRPETTLVLEPTTSDRFRRIEMRLGDDGRPLKIVQTLSRAFEGRETDVLFPKFESAGGVVVLKSFQQETVGRTDLVMFEYQKIDGFVLLASLERIVKDSRVGGSKTVFDDVEAGR